jgi:P-type conjugative transfer protein TrbJ
MNKVTRIITATALAAPLVGSQAHATAVIGATEPTQILNNIQLVGSQIAQLEQLAQQVQMVQTQLNQYQTMLRNLSSLPSAEWTHVASLLAQLQTAQSSASGFAYASSNWSTLFNAQHPGFATYVRNGNMSTTDFSTAYMRWNTEVGNAAVKAVGDANLNIDDFEDTQSTITTLNALSNNADGQKQAIQAGNKFAELLNQQILLLRQLIASQIQLQSSYLGTKNEQEAAQTASTTNALKSTGRFTTGGERYFTPPSR